MFQNQLLIAKTQKIKIKIKYKLIFFYSSFLLKRKYMLSELNMHLKSQVNYK